MYDVTAQVRGHWHALLRAAAQAAGVPIECVDHAAPAALTDLWARDDLALAFMCGLPLATRYPDVRPLAAPLTVLCRGGKASYRSAWIVRAESAFDTLAATFGQRIGWTVDHSHSGYSAPRQALLLHRTQDRPRLYRESVGPLGHPRAALAALAEGRIDVVALDAYWWWLLERHDPAAASGFRTIGDTADAPIPPLICSARFREASALRLGAALVALERNPGALPHLEAVGLRGFVRTARTDYAQLANVERAARAANYPSPA